MRGEEIGGCFDSGVGGRRESSGGVRFDDRVADGECSFDDLAAVVVLTVCVILRLVWSRCSFQPSFFRWIIVLC